MSTVESNDEQQINPDDVCGVCGFVREEHGDAHHQFTFDDKIIPLSPRPTPRREAPTERGTHPNTLAADPTQGQSKTEVIDKDLSQVAKSFATLLEILAEREYIGAKDIIRIFQGEG